MEERKRKSSLEKAMKSLGTVEVYYAKIICRLSNATRLKLYRKLASLLRNRFSLMNALDMIHEGASNGGKNPKEPMAIAIAAWGQALQNGKPFSEALRGWAPNQERLMLSVGDVSDMESAIMNLIRVSEGSTKMVRPIIGAIAYPSFLFMMSVLIIYAIGAFMVPPMLEAAPNTRWRGMAADLVDLSEWIRVNWIFAFSVLPVIGCIIYFTIGIWTGRARAFFDHLPPWSLYKIFRYQLAAGFVSSGQKRYAGFNVVTRSKTRFKPLFAGKNRQDAGLCQQR